MLMDDYLSLTGNRSGSSSSDGSNTLERCTPSALVEEEKENQEAQPEISGEPEPSEETEDSFTDAQKPSFPEASSPDATSQDQHVEKPQPVLGL